MKKRKGNEKKPGEDTSVKPRQRQRKRGKAFWIVVSISILLALFVLRDVVLRLLDNLELTNPAEALLRELARDPEGVLKMEMGVSDVGVRALVAREDVAEGDVILKLPPGWSMTEATLAPSIKSWSHSCLRTSPQCSPFAVLSLSLLAEKRRGRESPFRHYLRCLPDKFSNIFSFSFEQANNTDGRNAIKSLTGLVDQAADLAEKHPEAVVPAASREELTWALNVVLTRSFYMPRDDALGIRLAPILDLANHHPDHLKRSFNSPRQTDQKAQSGVTQRPLTWTSSRKLKRGEEINNHYGKHTNIYLLMNYGFADPRNKWGPKAHIMPTLPNDAFLELQKHNCKPEDLLGDDRYSAVIQLRLDRPTDEDGAFQIVDKDLRCVRIAEVILQAPDMLSDALKQGHFDRPPRADIPARLAACEGKALQKALKRCADIAASHEKDVAWWRLMQAHAEGKASITGDPQTSRALATAFEANYLAALGCMKGTQKRFDEFLEAVEAASDKMKGKGSQPATP